MSDDQRPDARTASLGQFADNLFSHIKGYVARNVAPVKAEQAKLAAALDALAGICELVPSRLAEIERRLHDLEAGNGR